MWKVYGNQTQEGSEKKNKNIDRRKEIRKLTDKIRILTVVFYNFILLSF